MLNRLTPDSQRNSTKSAKKAEYAKAGISIVASAFGATDTPTTSNADPTGTANTMAQWVKGNALDGIDVDYEDLAAMNKGDGAAEKWVTTFTQTLRKTLPKGQFILTHAPLAPWLAPNHQFAGGAYVTIHKNVGSLVDWVRLRNDLGRSYPTIWLTPVCSTTCSSTTRACTRRVTG